MLALQALSSSLNAGTAQKGAAWAKERLLGALRQSVFQNDRVHLHIIDCFPGNHMDEKGPPAGTATKMQILL